LILPDSDAFVKYHKLKSKGFNTFISKEWLVQVDHGILFGRWINPKFLQRFNGIDASEVLGWWDKLHKGLLSRLRQAIGEQRWTFHVRHPYQEILWWFSQSFQ